MNFIKLPRDIHYELFKNLTFIDIIKLYVIYKNELLNTILNYIEYINIRTDYAPIDITILYNNNTSLSYKIDVYYERLFYSCYYFINNIELETNSKLLNIFCEKLFNKYCEKFIMDLSNYDSNICYEYTQNKLVHIGKYISHTILLIKPYYTDNFIKNFTHFVISKSNIIPAVHRGRYAYVHYYYKKFYEGIFYNQIIFNICKDNTESRIPIILDPYELDRIVEIDWDEEDYKLLQIALLQYELKNTSSITSYHFPCGCRYD